jgi:ferredoxin
MMRRPVLDLSECTDCEGCIEMCPEVFRRNPAGYIELEDRDGYPEECVEDAIRCCPAHCITWEEDS